MKFKAIFFDSDGLLVDTEGLSFDATREVFASAGVEMSKEWYVRENLGKGRRSAELAREHGVSEDQITELMRKRVERYRQVLREGVTPMDGVLEVLEKLHGRLVMGVVTSSTKDSFDIIMEKTGLRQYFSFFLTREDVAQLKPHPEPYLKALERSGEQSDDCLVLEDSYRGVQAAKAAGLTCYAIPDDLTRSQNFSIADKVLHSIREVPDLIV